MAVAARKAGRATSAASKTSQAKKAVPNSPQFSKDQDLVAYREMLMIRRFEEKAGQMYGMGLIGGFCHLYIGQEAVVLGMQMATKEGDQVITGYRDHGHMLACGMDAKGVMAELTGRRGGLSKGKGGSMHMFSKEKHFYGGHGIVGAQVSLGTGIAFANRYRDERLRLPHLFRRRRRKPGPGLRELQHGGAVEAAGRLRDREQPLRDGHGGEPRFRADRLLEARRLLQHPGRAGRRHGRPRRLRRGRARDRPCPLRQGPLHPRNADLPLPRAFDVRPGEVPHEGRSHADARGV